MRRFLVTVGVGVSALLLAASARAQAEELPTELWAEYPLVQEVEPSRPPSGVGPFLPPVDRGADPVSDDAAPWALWALVAIVGLAALLVATRLSRSPVAARGEERRAPPLPPRSPVQRAPRRSLTKPLAQYAPSPSLVLVDAPEEPRRSVVRRTGLLRSRFVVLSGESERVAASRSFWNVASGERAAKAAWDDLMTDIRASGWEPEPTRRSEFYVLLQPIAPDDSSIVPTLEAYGRSADDA